MSSNAQVAITDADAYAQLSSEQRVLNIFKLAGHTDEQINNLTHRYSHMGVLINNLATCRDPKLKTECAKHRVALEAELAANLPRSPQRPWTTLEELELIIAAANGATVPARLQQAFDAANQLQADPA